nr:MAG TPA: hypothetical protein [Crassvirales sp.]
MPLIWIHFLLKECPNKVIQLFLLKLLYLKSRSFLFISPHLKQLHLLSGNSLPISILSITFMESL